MHSGHVELNLPYLGTLTLESRRIEAGPAQTSDSGRCTHGAVHQRPGDPNSDKSGAPLARREPPKDLGRGLGLSRSRRRLERLIAQQVEVEARPDQNALARGLVDGYAVVKRRGG